MQHLKTLGSTAVALKKSGTQKFEPKGESYIMVGYSQTAKAYRLFDTMNQNIVKLRDNLFNEVTSSKPNIIGTLKDIVEFYQTQKHYEVSSAISELDDEEFFRFSDEKSSDNDAS